MARKADPAPSTARVVRQYIDTHPTVRDALSMDIVNLSALTRRIMEATGLRKEEAILVACRRYTPQPVQKGYEAGIRRVLDKSKLEVRTRVAVLTVRSSWRLMGKLEKALHDLQGRNDPVHLLHGSESITVICDEGRVDGLEETLGAEEVIKRRGGLVEVNIRSPELIDEVPGILAFLATSLASRGINFVEVISCHKDNMFLIDEKDLFHAFEVLNGLIRAG